MSIYTKYPRTFHLPWSESVTSDDKVMGNTHAFDGMLVVITEKMDGENTTLYNDNIHARSIDSGNHPSRDWVKRYWANIRHNIPANIRVCGENVYAEHSVWYDDLPSYFMGFSVWQGDTCLSWEDTMEWFELLGITPVRVLYMGLFDETLIQGLIQGNMEGYVLRDAGSFAHDAFADHVGKYVRKNHVQTDTHWMHKTVVPNKLGAK